MTFQAVRLFALMTLSAALPTQAATADPHDAKAREIFSKVISYPTSEGLGQVPAMAAYLAGEFRGCWFSGGRYQGAATGRDGFAGSSLPWRR